VQHTSGLERRLIAKLLDMGVIGRRYVLNVRLSSVHHRWPEPPFSRLPFSEESRIRRILRYAGIPQVHKDLWKLHEADQ
jgi:hypothetical protein